MSHRLAVLLSGSGTNLQAMMDAIGDGRLSAEIALVLANRSDAGGLERARRAAIPVVSLPHQDYPDRDSFDQAMIREIDRHQPDTIALAGFMRILTPAFVAHYTGRLLNIHPSLLPRYPGLNTHQRALEAGDTEHGCSIHYVTDQLDGGPLIARASVPVLANDTTDSLSKRVQQREHQLYPMVLSWCSENRLKLTSQGVELDGKALPSTGFELDWQADADRAAALGSAGC